MDKGRLINRKPSLLSNLLVEHIYNTASLALSTYPLYVCNEKALYTTK